MVPIDSWNKLECSWDVVRDKGGKTTRVIEFHVRGGKMCPLGPGSFIELDDSEINGNGESDSSYNI